MSIRRVEKIDDEVPVQNALVSVSDKFGLGPLVQGLTDANPDVMIYSTGGTYAELKDILEDKLKKDPEHNLQQVSKYTGLPETEGGLVKTLHHKLFLGYLTETYCEAHQRDLERENAVPIDLVVINLYPFSEVVKKDGDIEDARGNIDVGGPSALRAAAKNWHRIATLVDPDDYCDFVEKLKIDNGNTLIGRRFELSKKVWDHLVEYNKAIADYHRNISKSKALAPYKIV